MNSIAIESEYGSGGLELGQLIASKMDMPFYDGKALIKAAYDFHLPMPLLKNYEPDEAENILKCLMIIAKQSDYEDISKIEEVFSSLQKTIQELDQHHPSVFMGHCANRILNEKNVKSVFIYASDYKDRIRRVMEKKSVSKEQSVKLICQEDAYRKNYFTFGTKENWRDWNGYDIALNTSRIPIERCSEILIKEMQAEKG